MLTRWKQKTPSVSLNGFGCAIYSTQSESIHCMPGQWIQISQDCWSPKCMFCMFRRRNLARAYASVLDSHSSWSQTALLYILQHSWPAQLKCWNRENETTAEQLDKMLGVFRLSWATIFHTHPYSEYSTIFPPTARNACGQRQPILPTSKPLKSSFAQSVHHPLESTGPSPDPGRHQVLQS